MGKPKIAKPAKPVISAIRAKAAKAVMRKSSPQKASPAGSKPIGLNSINSWLQDATLEAPVPPQPTFVPGSRELEFSVGMRQQELEGLVRSELRGRALVHTKGQVLALVEASYVHVAAQSGLPQDLPQQLYKQLKPQLERLLAMGGHTPPLPASLDQVA